MYNRASRSCDQSWTTVSSSNTLRLTQTMPMYVQVCCGSILPERIKCVIAGSEQGLSADASRRNFMAVSNGDVSWQKVLSDQIGFRLKCRAANHEDHSYCCVIPREDGWKGVVGVLRWHLHQRRYQPSVARPS